MRQAIIDLGTNTFNLLIIEMMEKTKYQILFHDKVAVKLGKDCIDKNIISDEAIARALHALHFLLNSIKKYDTTKIRAIATSAIRSAKNGDLFVQKIKNELNLTIEVISGDEEAELIYYGVRQALELGKEKNLIMDIGGGSTEFIIANDSQIFWKHSFNLGISRLIEKFKPHDPLLKEEISMLKKYLMQELLPLLNAAKKFKSRILIGSSGSFDTMADLILAKKNDSYLSKEATTYNYDINDYRNLHTALLKSTYQQRLAMKGMVDMRADMMVFGSIFINLILNELQISEMKLSTFALKEGVAYKMMN